MRLIDADELKKKTKAPDKNNFTVFVEEVLIGLIDEAPTVEPASPWHRVEDELPDKYTQCLVADADGKCAVGYYRYDCEAWDSPAFGWIEAEDRKYIDYMPMGIGKVVAWMPLPEPPGEDADGQDNASCS